MAKRKQGNRVKERVGVTIQLVIGEDDDLIEWWRTIERGHGQRTVKTALRSSLGLPITDSSTNAIQQLYAETSAAFDAVSLELNSERQRADAFEAELKRVTTITASLPTLVRQLAQATPATPIIDIAEIDGMKNQLAALVARIEEVAAMRGGTARPVKKRTLTEDEIAEREAQLAKASW